MSPIRHTPLAPTVSEARAGGEVIDRHRHDDHQLIYVSARVLAITTAAGTWVAAPDRAMWVPAGLWHEHRFFGRCAFHTVGFPRDAGPERPPGVLAVSPLVRELVVACTDTGLPPDQAGRLRAVLSDRLGTAEERPLALPTPSDPRLADACALVHDDLGTPRSIADLARAVGSSERTLSRLFRCEFGTTYPQWRTRVRVFAALVELAGGATVTETAHHCGWATASAFVDTFTRTMGRTPGTYRVGRKPVPVGRGIAFDVRADSPTRGVG